MASPQPPRSRCSRRPRPATKRLFPAPSKGSPPARGPGSLQASPGANDFSEVDDVVQETCLRAFRIWMASPTNRRAAFLAWLPPSPTTSSSTVFAMRGAPAARGMKFLSVRPATARSGAGRHQDAQPALRQQEARRTPARPLGRATEDYGKRSSWPRSRVSLPLKWPSAWGKSAKPWPCWCTAR